MVVMDVDGKCKKSYDALESVTLNGVLEGSILPHGHMDISALLSSVYDCTKECN